MPRIVDAGQRRAEIAEACWRVIVRDGIAGVTTRSLAREAGMSSSVLFHYFRDKDDLILASFEHLEDRFRDHLRRTVGRASDSLGRLRAMAYSNLPLGEDRYVEFGVWLSLWAHSYSSESLRARYQQLYQGWREILANTVRDAIGEGLLHPGIAPAIAAMQLTGLTDGLIVQILLNPGQPEVTQLAVASVDALIQSWTVQPGQKAQPVHAEESYRDAAQ